MKHIAFLFFAILPFFAFGQVEDTPLFVGKYFGNQTGGGAGYWQVSGNFTDESGYYNAENIQVGDVLFFVDSGIGYHLPVVTIVSATGSSFTIRVNNTGITGVSAVPNGAGGIYRPNSPKGLYPYAAGLVNSDQQVLNSYLIKLINQELIKRDTSIAVTVDYNLGSAVGVDKLRRLYRKVTISLAGVGNKRVLTLPDGDADMADLEIIVAATEDTIQVQATGNDAIADNFRKVPPAATGLYKCVITGGQFVWRGGIFDRLIVNADLANATITPVKLNATGATGGQVLKYNSITGLVGWARDSSIYAGDGTLPAGTTRRILMPSLSSGYKEWYSDPGYTIELFTASGNNFSNSSSHQLRTLYGSLDSKHRNIATYTGGGIKLNSDFQQEVYKNSQARLLSRLTSTYGNTGGAGWEYRSFYEQSMDSTSAKYLNLLFSKFDGVSAGGRGHYVGFAKGSTADIGNYNYSYPTTSFSVNTSFYGNSVAQFRWILVDNMDTDTTGHYVSFYNKKWKIPNSSPGSGNKIIEWQSGTPVWISTPSGGGGSTPERVFLESSTATSVDLDAGTTVKDKDGTNTTFTFPTSLSGLRVFKNGILLAETGTSTTRDYSCNTGTNTITFTVALVSTDRVIIEK